MGWIRTIHVTLMDCFFFYFEQRLSLHLFFLLENEPFFCEDNEPLFWRSQARQYGTRESIM
jgi:hypothetical protein